MTLTVSQLNNQIKSILESTFERVTVRGEISRITYHSSGHLYFDIKDKHSTLNCVMFRGNVSKLKFRLEQGQDIVLDANISVYIPRGTYQLNCFSATPAGEGALALAYEQLKKKLDQKGYFDKECKKALPLYPKHIVVVTSKTGAALQDMLRVAQKRWNLLKITLVNSLVQGESAANNLAQAIKKADTLNGDILIVGRGGGSIEDLWCFNEEIVADEIYKAKTPTISAVGHEIDYVISDFVADVRAATPSNAMEIALPDSYEMMMNISGLIDTLERSFKSSLANKIEIFNHIKTLLLQNSPKEKLNQKEDTLKDLQKRITLQLEFFLQQRELQLNPLYDSLKISAETLLKRKEFLLNSLQNNLEALDPKKVLKDGYAQVLQEEKPIELDKLSLQEEITLIDKKTKITAKVTKKHSL